VKIYKYYLLSLGIIILDQVVKMIVHFNMELSEEIPVFGDWFKIHYTENPGMAFGIQIDWEYGKLLLTFFRLFAMVAIGYYISILAKKEVHQGLIWCVALILAGAIGNVIDSTFYGVLIDNAPVNASTPWFHGKVVDMFYIDIWSGIVADWVPIWGGQRLFLWPIFNVADASIFVGVAIILIFQKRFFADNNKSDEGSVENEEDLTETDPEIASKTD
jgi:signal peptidase II